MRAATVIRGQIGAESTSFWVLGPGSLLFGYTSHMPMMADIDDPPKSRTKGVLIGIAIATPAAFLIFGVVLPYLYAMIVGGAASLDQRIALEGDYMRTLCTEALVLERDETLCECALASELPGIDCRAQFEHWTVLRQNEQCSDPTIGDTALSFCTCVQTLHENLQNSATAKERGEIIGRYRNCAELPDAMHLPEIESLIPPDRK